MPNFPIYNYQQVVHFIDESTLNLSHRFSWWESQKEASLYKKHPNMHARWENNNNNNKNNNKKIFKGCHI